MKFLNQIILFFIQLRLNLHFNRKIRIFFSNHTEKIIRNKKLELKHKRKWRKLKNNVNVKWMLLYNSVNGIESPDFISEDIYYSIVEPTLNDYRFENYYSDKNNLDKLVDNELCPNVCLRNINGTYYDNNYNAFLLSENKLSGLLANYKKVVIKPSIESGGGRKISIFFNQDNAYYNFENEKLDISYLKQNYSKNFLIEEYVEQHNYFKNFNPTSLNTIRIMTYRSVIDEDIGFLGATLRFGKKGSFVDNQNSGGLACGIDLNGKLSNYCFDRYGNKKNIIDVIENYNELCYLYKYEEIKKVAFKIAKSIPYHRLLGFDFCVDQNGQVRLIEINNRFLGVNIIQFASGPLFKDYTNEVIQYCLHEKPKFSIRI